MIKLGVKTSRIELVFHPYMPICRIGYPLHVSKPFLSRPKAATSFVRTFSSCIFRMAAASTDPPRERIVQDSWRLPERSQEEPRLRVYNSLTRQKDDFITRKPGIVTWYNCGPTVYDASHMGHARNYMAQDIMRRILRDYFGYEVNFVMNVTDVDDKIIVRARQSHLLKAYSEKYISPSASLFESLISDAKSAWTTYFYKTISEHMSGSTSSPQSYENAQVIWRLVLEKEKDGNWLEAQKAKAEKFGMYVTALKTGAKGIVAAEEVRGNAASTEDSNALIESNKDAIGAWLDKQLGSTVTDPSVFRDLAAYWEDSFFKSMEALHVERPTTLTRVSEYIPEIVKFVEGIVHRGMAYEAGGSVWFNTANFEGSQGSDGNQWKHTYAKLQPWSKGNRELLEDGEGSLTETAGKRSASDFALWKASKPGEPQWESPWGAGRPGWHIECSVMASAILGEGMDVHSGGIDLAFPHHDNEIAQSEAYHNCRQWVNYFLHTGHLHIEGLKMAKSLKNFISIEEALTKYSARQLRLAFLSQLWSARLDFKESVMQEVRTSETVLINFFARVNGLVGEARAGSVSSDGKHHYEEAERELSNKLEAAQIAFRQALCDSFDSPKGIDIVMDLVSAANVYLQRGRHSINVSSVESVSEWVTRMLRMFGLGEGSPISSTGETVIGWGSSQSSSSVSGTDRETVLMPYLRTLSAFRDGVRKLAMQGASSHEILALTDQLRNIDLVDLGVVLDDQDDGKALVKLVDVEILQRAREEKVAAAEAKAARKNELAVALESKRLQKLEKGKIAPSDMFKSQVGEFSAWDDAGLPTLDQDGNELPKSRRKKLAKEWELQKKLHDEYLLERSSQNKSFYSFST